MIYTRPTGKPKARWCRGATSAAWCPASSTPGASAQHHPPVVPAAAATWAEQMLTTLPGVHRLWINANPSAPCVKTCARWRPPCSWRAPRIWEKMHHHQHQAAGNRGLRRAVCQDLRRLPALAEKPRAANALDGCALPLNFWLVFRAPQNFLGLRDVHVVSDWRRAHSPMWCGSSACWACRWSEVYGLTESSGMVPATG